MDIRAAHVSGDSARDVARALTSQLHRPLRPPPRLLLYFASPRYDRQSLAEAVKEAHPDTLTVGCTTMGEVGIKGFRGGSVSALALGGEGFDAAGALLEGLSSMKFAKTTGMIRDVCAAIGTSPLEAAVSNHFGITLTDGLSGMEEVLMASLGFEAVGLPIVGGSAGDDFAMKETTVYFEGRAATDAAAFVLCRCPTPFHVFRANHYLATNKRVVVTEAQPDRRRIRELDGYPAVTRYAELLGVTEEDLRADPRRVLAKAACNLAFFVNGTPYMRSVMTVDGDDLLMGGAIETGVVMTLMRAGDLLESTRETMRGIRTALAGDVGGLVLFDCGGRLYEARAAGIEAQVADAMVISPAAGFHTYGEQFGCLQVNHTLTGVALSRGDRTEAA